MKVEPPVVNGDPTPWQQTAINALLEVARRDGNLLRMSGSGSLARPPM